MNKASLIFYILIAIFFASCEESKPAKSSLLSNKSGYEDIINIPATASGNTVDTINVPKIEFEETTFNFGEVNEGEIVEHDYNFTNIGKKDLVILDTKSSCGCTVPYYDKAPIPPGGSGTIKIKFDTKGKSRGQEKKVTIFTNCNPAQYKLKVAGHVYPTIQK
jgi:hypothetical protein